MRKIIVHSIFLLILSINVFAQTDEEVSYKTAPVKWERYKVSGRDITLNFPKLPVKRTVFDLCNNIESETFGAYAKQRAYIFTVYAKSKQSFPSSCRQKVEFSEQNFKKRKEELDKSYSNIPTNQKVKYSKGEVYKYSQGNSIIWLVNDYENESWYEFSIAGASDSEAFTNFINTLERKSNRSVIEIHNGANSTIGDEDYTSESTSSTETSNLQIYYKPRANYTEQARKNQTQGTITLRVVFHASGAISSVSAVSGLPDGLMEESISAAKNIIFRPSIKEGKPQTVSRQVQYTFTLY